jgi:putative ABC transport system substrate-binding protein
VRRLGVFIGTAADDADTKDRIAGFLQILGQLGWTEGRNLSVELRAGSGNAEVMRKNATELLAWAPDVILAQGGSSVSALLQQTRTVPVVFTIVPDPIGSGFVKSLSRPGGNATGFMQFEYSLTGKWAELLKQIAPNVTRAVVLWDPSVPAGIGQFAVIQSVAPSLGIDVTPVDLRDIPEAERTIADFSRQPNGGMIITAGPLGSIHRDLIVRLAAQHRLPAAYSNRYFVDLGGLASYGADLADPFRRAASYVDRVLKGEKPGDLPVQAPTKYELVINLKTAKALGITVPATLLARADQVID